MLMSFYWGHFDRAIMTYVAKLRDTMTGATLTGAIVTGAILTWIRLLDTTVNNNRAVFPFVSDGFYVVNITLFIIVAYYHLTCKENPVLDHPDMKRIGNTTYNTTVYYGSYTIYNETDIESYELHSYRNNTTSSKGELVELVEYSKCRRIIGCLFTVKTLQAQLILLEMAFLYIFIFLTDLRQMIMPLISLYVAMVTYVSFLFVMNRIAHFHIHETQRRTMILCVYIVTLLIYSIRSVPVLLMSIIKYYKYVVEAKRIEDGDNRDVRKIEITPDLEIETHI